MKMTKLLFLLALITITFGCGFDGLDTSQSNTSQTNRAQAVILHGWDINITCCQKDYAYVKNLTHKDIRVVIQSVATHRFKRKVINEFKTTYTLGPRETKILGCLVVGYVGEGGCSVDISYDILSVSYVSYFSTKIYLASKGPDIIGTEITKRWEKDCEYNCVNKTGYGRFIDHVINQDVNVSDSIKRLYNMLAAGRSEISKLEFMDIFGVKEDPCARDDVIMGDRFSNSGELCYFRVAFNTGSRTRSLEVHMPKFIDGKLTRQGDKYKITFTNKLHAPFVDIEGPLNRDYGGIIVELMLTTEAFFLGTESGCIGLRY